MLELKNIKKDYPAGDGTVHALRGINLKFRESEFVSILVPPVAARPPFLISSADSTSIRTAIL